MNESQIWIDGNLRPASEATVHILSHAVQRGSTVFDVLRVCETEDGPSAFGLRPHMARFDRSMNLMGMTSTWALDQLEEAVAVTTLANPGTTLVKVIAAWVSSPVTTLPDTTVPQISIAALAAPLADPLHTPGVRARTATATKIPPEVLPPGLKVAAAYTYGIRQKLAARAEGYDEIILRTPQGDLAESVSQSLFVVRDDLLLVPPLDVVLDGITRRMVLDVAHHLGCHSQVRAISWDEVATADELFLCATTNPVTPVRELDGRELPSPGPMAAELAAEAVEVLAGRHPLSRRWLAPLGPLARAGTRSLRETPVMTAAPSDRPLYSHEESIDIAAPPALVWGLVTAMDRYGEWSSENQGGYWRKNADGIPYTGQVGEEFVGVNRRGDQEWKALVEIVEREEGTSFAFVTGGTALNYVHWRYVLEPTDGGTRLTEQWALRNLSPIMVEGGQVEVDRRVANAKESLAATLAGMKAEAERQVAAD